jgi:hypothetical protein
MKIGTALGMMAIVLPVLAACGDQGGELREATARRRAQQASLDSAGGDTAGAMRTPGDTGFQIPAFDLGDSAAKAGPDSTAAPADTTPAAPPSEWTAGVRQVGRPSAAPATLRDIRVGRNTGFDRVVLQFDGERFPGWHVEYVDGPVPQCGSGEPSEIAGAAWLMIRLTSAQAHDDAGRVTVRGRERDVNLPVVRELEMTCDFEGQVEVVLGVSSPNRFRVTEVPNPARLVIDVQQ